MYWPVAMTVDHLSFQTYGYFYKIELILSYHKQCYELKLKLNRFIFNLTLDWLNSNIINNSNNLIKISMKEKVIKISR